MLLIKEYLAQLHILNAILKWQYIQIVDKRLQRRTSTRIWKLWYPNKKMGRTRNYSACMKQHNIQWLYKLYLEKKMKRKNTDIVQSKLQDTKYSIWDEISEKKAKWLWVDNGQIHDSIKSIQRLLGVSGICTYYN